MYYVPRAVLGVQDTMNKSACPAFVGRTKNRRPDRRWRGPPWVWQLGRACPPCIFSQTELVGFLGGASGKELSFFTEICTCHGLYLWLSSKESSCNAGDTSNTGSIPGLGRSPGGGHGNPLQYSCPENTHGRRSLVGYSSGSQRVRHDWVGKYSTAHPVPRKYSMNKLNRIEWPAPQHSFILQIFTEPNQQKKHLCPCGTYMLMVEYRW